MATSQMDLEKLKSDLMGDAQQAEQRANSAFATRGAPEETSFSPKAFRIAKQTFGEAELASADDAIGRLLTHLKTEAAFKDQNEAGVFEANMKKKLYQYRMAAIRQAGEIDKKMAKAGVERAQRDKVLKGLSGLSEAAAFSIAMGIGSSGPPTPIADSMKSPDLGSQFQPSGGPSLGVDTALSADTSPAGQIASNESPWRL